MLLVLESGAALIENDLYALPAGPSGQVDMADSAAGGQRRRQKTEARGTRMMRSDETFCARCDSLRVLDFGLAA